MGLPDSHDIEPTREDTMDGYDHQPEFVIQDVADNEQMEVEGDESEVNNGYLRLQTFESHDEIPADDSDSSGSDNEDEIESNFDVEDNIPVEAEPSGVPQILSADSELQAQVWNSPRPQDTIELNSEKTQQILKAMSSFSLPNVPAWANEVNPSELIQRIKNKEAAPSRNDKK